MAFDWGTDINQATEDAINRLDDYNSGNFNATSNPFGLAGGGHITNFPAALSDTAKTAAGFALFADLMTAYANSASASALAATNSAANLAGSSTSTVAISTGAKSFATQSGKTWPAGSYLLLTSDANPTTHFMVLSVTAYTGTALSGTAILAAGSGSRSDWTIRLTGVPGRFPGHPYLWSTNTSAVPSDPTTGKVRLNAVPGSATAIFISETDVDGNALGPLIATWSGSTSATKGRLYIQNITAPTNFVILDVTSNVTDNGTYDSAAVVSVVNGGTLADGAQVSIFFIPYGNAGDTGPIGATGATGPTGPTGATGDDAGFEFAFNTTLSGNPGTGKFGFNAAFASATIWAVSETDGNGLDVSALLAALDNGTGTNKILVFAIKQGGSAYFAFHVTTALTDQGTYDTFTIVPISTAGTILNNDTFHIITIPLEPGPTGATGIAGPTTAPVWTFDSGTSAIDPGPNEFAFNNASAASATVLYINETGVGSADVSVFIQSWDDSTNSTHRGSLYIIQTTDPSKYAIFTVGTVTDSGTYDSVAITYVAGPGGFTAGQACAFSFTRSGNAGAGAGNVVGPTLGTAINNGIVLFDGTTGQLIKTGSVVGALAYLNTVASAQIDANAVSLDKLATQAAGTVLANVTGGAAVPTASLITTTFKTALALTATDVGLGNVNNTSDANKPISTAERVLLDLRSFVRVRAVSTSNITNLSTALNAGDSIDGVTLVNGDAVLVAGQSSSADNGIYTVAASPARHTEYAAFASYPGLMVVVQEGTTNADTLWLSTANAGGTINTTPLPFLQHGGPSGAGGRTVLVATDMAGVQAAAGLSIGTNVQAFDALLTSVAAQAMIADRYFYGTGTDAVTLGTITAAGRAILDDAAATDQLTTLGFSAYGKTLIDDADASTALSTLGFSAFAKTLIDDTDAPTALATLGAVGKQAIPVPSGSMEPAATNGAASGNVTLTNQKFVTKDFDSTTQEAVYFSFRMPQQWNESTVSFQLVWSHDATTTNFGTVFELAAAAVGDNEAGDTAFGTAQTVTDTGGTTNRLYITPESAAITVANTPQAGDYVFFRLRRVPANGSDTLAVDARVHELTLYITTNAGNDT